MAAPLESACWKNSMEVHEKMKKRKTCEMTCFKTGKQCVSSCAAWDDDTDSCIIITTYIKVTEGVFVKIHE